MESQITRETDENAITTDENVTSTKTFEMKENKNEGKFLTVIELAKENNESVNKSKYRKY